MALFPPEYTTKSKEPVIPELKPSMKRAPKKPSRPNPIKQPGAVYTVYNPKLHNK